MSRPRYVRHRSFDRLRHSRKFLAWLDEQADRLTLTAQFIFEQLLVAMGLTFEQVEDVAPGEYEAPANTVAPSITGTAQEGQTLTAVDGTWTGSPEPTITRQWQRDGEPIEGETGTTYDLVADDVGTVITLAVTATNVVGSDTEISDPTATVIAA